MVRCRGYQPKKLLFGREGARERGGEGRAREEKGKRREEKGKGSLIRSSLLPSSLRRMKTSKGVTPVHPPRDDFTLPTWNQPRSKTKNPKENKKPTVHE